VAGPLTAGNSFNGSTFANLKISGKTVANVAPNTTVDVKLLGITVARVALMEETGTANVTSSFNTATASINMIHAPPLAPLRGLPAGAEIIVGHSDAQATYPSGIPCDSHGAILSGEAFTAFAQGKLLGAPILTAKVGDAVLAPTGGSNANEILNLNLPPV